MTKMSWLKNQVRTLLVMADAWEVEDGGGGGGGFGMAIFFC